MNGWQLYGSICFSTISILSSNSGHFVAQIEQWVSECMSLNELVCSIYVPLNGFNEVFELSD